MPKIKPQTRKLAAAEALTNLIAGYFVGFWLMFFAAPHYEITFSPEQAAVFSGWFPVASLFRIYFRRLIFARIFPRDQSLLLSAIETAADMMLGFAIAVALLVYAAPLNGIIIPAPYLFDYALIFTTAALIRSYAIRRLFNGL